MKSGQKPRYYAAVLSGKKDRDLSSVSSYCEALCKLTVSMMHTGKLVCFRLVETLCNLGGNVKFILVLVRKKLAKCSTVLGLLFVVSVSHQGLSLEFVRAGRLLQLCYCLSAVKFDAGAG